MRYTFFILILFLFGCNSEKKQSRQLSQKQQDSIRAYELFNAALMFNLQEAPEKALPLYDSAISVKNDEGLFYTNRGITKYNLGDTIGGLWDEFKAIELDSLDATAYQNLSVIYGGMRNDTLSLHYAERAWQVEPTANNLYNIGASKYLLKDYKGCMSVFFEYLNDKKTPFRDMAFYLLGNCYAELNDNYNAQRCWNKANELAGYDLKTEMDKTKK